MTGAPLDPADPQRMLRALREQAPASDREVAAANGMAVAWLTLDGGERFSRTFLKSQRVDGQVVSLLVHDDDGEPAFQLVLRAADWPLIAEPEDVRS